MLHTRDAIGADSTIYGGDEVPEAAFGYEAEGIDETFNGGVIAALVGKV